MTISTAPRVTLGGTIQSALTHFCGFGLAAVLEEVGVPDVHVWWSDTVPPRLIVSGATEDEVDGIVRNHAAMATQSDHWVQARLSAGPRHGIALFSPRVKGADSREEWNRYLDERESALDALVGALDQDLIAALGSPAHWRETAKERNPDAGASRWDMKTRNRGEELVSHRLAPLASVLAGRNHGEVVDGITGRALRDETGSKESRTSSGFTQPQPTDSAVAWLALWGISWFPLAQSTTRVAVTPGAHPSRVTHPTMMALPIFTSPTRPALWRTVLRSQQLARAIDQESVVARRELNECGVVGIACFPIRKAGSASAPERIVLDGRLDVFQR